MVHGWAEEANEIQARKSTGGLQSWKSIYLLFSFLIILFYFRNIKLMFNIFFNGFYLCKLFLKKKILF